MIISRRSTTTRHATRRGRRRLILWWARQNARSRLAQAPIAIDAIVIPTCIGECSRRCGRRSKRQPRAAEPSSASLQAGATRAHEPLFPITKNAFTRKAAGEDYVIERSSGGPANALSAAPLLLRGRGRCVHSATDANLFTPSWTSFTQSIIFPAILEIASVRHRRRDCQHNRTLFQPGPGVGVMFSPLRLLGDPVANAIARRSPRTSLAHDSSPSRLPLAVL